MCYTLPKIWQGRIQKYWDKIMPSDYPVSSSVFSIKFEDDATSAAVATMEQQIGTDESVVLTMIPENTTVTRYVGTYDVVGEEGELTLLSPEKVSSENITVMHYVDDAWVKVEDFEIKDGYVWGTLDSFSPIAIFEYRKDIHEETVSFLKFKAIVCEGNAVIIKTNDNNKAVVVNPATRKEIEITENSVVVGGTVDGSNVETTSVTVANMEPCAQLKAVYAGSYWYSDDTSSATVDTANVYVVNSTVRAVVGMGGATRVNKVNIKIKDSTVTSHVSCGETTISKLGKDANAANPTFANRGWVKDSVIDLENVKVWLVYGAGNSGYLYTDNCKLIVDNIRDCDYFTVAGSNGYTKKAAATVKNVDMKQLQFNNRGGVGSASAVVVDSKIDLISIGGDNSEGDVDGTIDLVRLEINSGNSEAVVKLGVNGTETITADNVDVVKVSRNAGDVTVDASVINVLGNKYVVK